ncbi:MAG: hypothetical protein WCC64_23080 [Aliidongia sp.]
MELVILPKQYLEEEGATTNPDFIAGLNAAGLKWEVYDWQPNKASSEFQSEIASIARAYYKKKGYQC